MSQILEFHQKLLAAWPLSPVAVIEVDQKRMKALEKPIVDSYESQINLLASFADINFCYSHCGNRVTFTFLAGVYGRIAKRVKEMNAILRHTTKQPELAGYYGNVLDSVDVYVMMKADFEHYQPIFESRRLDAFWDTTEPDWEAVNTAFKSAK